jgi:hypothetical protein
VTLERRVEFSGLRLRKSHLGANKTPMPESGGKYNVSSLSGTVI